MCEIILEPSRYNTEKDLIPIPMSTIICANTHKEKTVEQDIAVQSYFDLTMMLGMRSLNVECCRYI